MTLIDFILSAKGILLLILLFLIGIFSFRHLIIGRLWKYRREVIMSNIQSSFPEKSKEEHQTIVNSYYRHLCDLLVEPFLTLSNRSIKRVNFNQKDVVEKLGKEGKDIVLFCSHYGNWEYMCMLPLFVPYEVVAVYTPVKNSFVNKFLMYLRGRHGVKLVAKDKYYKYIMGPRTTDKPRLFLVIGDQSPTANSLKMRFPFLNHNTPVQMGAARIARKLKCALVYMDVTKVKRYSYDYSFKLLSDSADKLDDMTIMKLCYSELEKTIQRKPDYWLWSHRRWKHEHVE